MKVPGWLASVFLAAMAAVHAGHAQEDMEPMGSDPIDSRHLTRVVFGAYSHWLQPWRGYLETMPASRLVKGIGIVLNTHRGEDASQILRMCARNGFKHARIEIGWGSLAFEDETRLTNADDAAARLRACKASGLRPLILLNGHHGAPCPLVRFERRVAAEAPAGAREVVLDDAGGLVLGKSGLSLPRQSVAAEYLVTAVTGNAVTLSKPLAEKLVAGTKLRMATLKYAPFGDANTVEGRVTLQGWQRYVRTVAEFAAKVLETGNRPDRGFDLEIWNEMSFGSNFMHQSRYYDPVPVPFPEKEVPLEVVKATAAVAEAHAKTFVGVKLVNGFSNTLPWPASAEMPPRVGALSHHPYAGRKVFPQSPPKGTPLNALGLKDASGFQPLYEASFPEYFATALQTETIVRDMAPMVTEIYRTRHGRFARPGNPCWTWITEVNYSPGEDGVNDPAQALRLKAKAITRYLCFYLNKGVERLYLYAAGANQPDLGDLELGVLRQEFVNQTVDTKDYPEDDTSVTSPALMAVRRLVNQFSEGLDAGMGAPRPLELVAVEDSHGAKQFEGDANDLRARPPLYNRDVFTFLPYQVNARRFVIPCYVMTRDIRQDLAPQTFTLTVKGFREGSLAVSAYDPLLNQEVAARVVGTAGDAVKIEVTVPDYPVLLVVEEK